MDVAWTMRVVAMGRVLNLKSLTNEFQIAMYLKV